MKGVVACAGVLLALASGAGASTTEVGSGLHGRVCRGPMPVPPDPSRCVLPLRTILVFTRTGRTVRIRSNADGTYRASLDPGIYRVQLTIRVGVSPPRLRPTMVHVRRGHDDLLNLYLDTRRP